MRALLVCVFVAHVAAQTCPASCSGQGLCDTGRSLECTCLQGFTGHDCSLRTCPFGNAWAAFSSLSGDAHDQVLECSGMGDCDRVAGKCNCRQGFEGDACEKMACPENCNSQGRCISLRMAGAGYDAFRLKVPPLQYNEWDADRVFGCLCDNGYAGPSCAEPACPEGHDPMSVSPVSEIQTLTCSSPNGCTSGSFIVSLGERQVGIPFNAVALTAQEDVTAASGTGFARGESVQSRLSQLRDWPTFRTVTFGGAATTTCGTAGSTTITVELLRSAGNMPVLGMTTGSLKDASGGIVSVFSTTIQEATTVREECSGRGLCNLGVCQCEAGYFTSNGDNDEGYIPDCGAWKNIVNHLPAVKPNVGPCPNSGCGGNGVCQGAAGDWRCICFSGWGGPGCSVALCPLGRAWFDEPAADGTAHAFVQCSNAGKCDTSRGRCQCFPGFTGGSCQQTACPSLTTSTVCSGHGRCLNLREMAAAGTANGEHVGNLEVNTLTCDMTAGSFTLSHRNYVTIAISFTATPAALKAALQQLPSIGLVDVRTEPHTASSVCDVGGRATAITFLSDLGDQSNLIVVPTGTGTATVAETVKGTRPSYGDDLLGGTQWDADAITSCVCDGYGDGNRTGKGSDSAFWIGTGCTERSCPTGINPSGYLEEMAFEVQRLSCAASSGSFALYFRTYTSKPIPFDTTFAELKVLLEALPSVGSVSLAKVAGTAWSGQDRVCGTAMQAAVTDITFLTELGDVPLMKADAYKLSGVVSVTEGVKGFGSQAECSNKGSCARDEGVCECDAFYFSSNGKGKPGRRGDCGAYEVQGVLGVRGEL